MLAAKHLDPVVGIDVHIVMLTTPMGPIPTPLPFPFIGMVFDPVDYLPLIGATVSVNGHWRANAGTGVFAVSVHLPLGGPFLKPPANEGEIFMGSTTVEVDGEPMSFSNVLALTCQDIGVPPPLRLTKSRMPKSLYLPNGMVIPIPSGPLVLVGGSPTVSLMSIASKLLMGPPAQASGQVTRQGDQAARSLLG